MDFPSPLLLPEIGFDDFLKFITDLTRFWAKNAILLLNPII